jgi:hypothetical protein
MGWKQTRKISDPITLLYCKCRFAPASQHDHEGIFLVCSRTSLPEYLQLFTQHVAGLLFLNIFNCSLSMAHSSGFKYTRVLVSGL